MEKSSANTPRPKKILVTGSTGFVGSHLCRQLEDQGHVVYGLARSSEKFEKLKISGTCLTGHLSSQGRLPFIEKLPQDLDVVYHVAGIVSSFDLDQFYEINYHATENLINHLKRKYSQLQFILLSSLAAAGPEAPKETDVPKPVSHYGKSKLLAEKSLLSLAPEGWIATTIRPPMVIGPGDQAVLDIFKMVKGKIVLVAGLSALKNRYSFICIFDLVNLLIKALDQQEGNSPPFLRTYYSSYPQEITMEQLVLSIQKKLGIKKIYFLKLPIFLVKFVATLLRPLSGLVKNEIRLTPDKVSELTPKAWVCKAEQGEKDLKFEYQWDLDKTVTTTLSDYQQRGWI